MNFLFSIIRTPQGIVSDATDKEKAEYASNLLKLGSLKEAEKILNEIDAEKMPIVNYYKAFIHIYRWEYKLALPPFFS